jgi:rhomboid protease GluP
MVDFFRILFTTVYGWIIVVNVVVWLVPQFGIIGENRLINLGANNGQLIRSGEYYRLLTAQFLHNGILHLFLNMYFVYSVGGILTDYFGQLINGNENLNFLMVYIFAGIIGGLASGFLTDNFSIGASGAVFGLLGALAIIAFKTNNPALGQVVGINLVLNIIFGFSIPGIDVTAHAGGFAGGALMTFLLMVF